MMVSLLSSSSNWPRNSPHGSEQQVDYPVRVHVEHACNEGVQALAKELRSGVTGSKGRHEDVSAGEFSHVLLDGVVHVDHLVAHGEDAVVVAFAVQEDPEESLLGGGHMRLVRVFSPTFTRSYSPSVCPTSVGPRCAGSGKGRAPHPRR